MVKKYLSTRRFISVCAVFTLMVLGLFFILNIQNADGKKKKEEKVKEFLKATVNLNIKWDIDDENNKSQGSMSLRAKGRLKLNKEMSSMDQGLPAVMVNYKSQNMMAHYSYKGTITVKDPPDDCPNSVIEKYEGSGNTMCKPVPGPGNLIMNHFASMFKDTGLGDMASSMVEGMLVDHYLFVIPCEEIEVNGQKLDQSSCTNRPSTTRMKITTNITGKIEKNGKMEGKKTWAVKVISASSSPWMGAKINELPKSINNKPFVPEKASDGNVTYSLSWKIEKIEPHVLIYRLKDNDWHDITDGTPNEEEQEIFPGEKLTLKAVVVMPGETGEPPKGQWEITGKDKILKDWIAREGGTDEIEVTEFTKKEIEFFWWKEVKTAKVKYTVKGLTGKTEFKLIFPETTVDYNPGRNLAPSKGADGCEIVPDSPSMQLRSTVSVKKNKPFSLQYVQLVRGNNWSLRANYSKGNFSWYKDVHDYMLDSTYPYNGVNSGSQRVVKEMIDTPGAPIKRTTASIHWDQEFITYLMFRPGSMDEGNAWVPLKRVNWGWQATLFSYKNPFSSGDPACGKRMDIAGGAKTLPIDYDYQAKTAQEYPEWDQTVPQTPMEGTGLEVPNSGDSYKETPSLP